MGGVLGCQMDSVQFLSRLLLVGAFVVSLSLLWAQASALRHTHHKSFLVLIISSLSGLAYLIMATAGGFMVTSEETKTVLFFVTSLALLVQLAVGLWGSIWIILAYRQLYDAVKPTALKG